MDEAGRVLETLDLGRCFGTRTAIAEVTVRLAAGEVLGLAGPNGSGKTTFLKVLGGLLRPSFGTVRVFGRDPFRDRAAVMERARFAFAPPPLYERLTATEHLRYLGAIGPWPRPTPTEIVEVLELVGLEGRSHEAVRAFSCGMRQRMGLAIALLPRPELLVLDEPADGLDPLAVLELRAVLARLRSEHGVAIVLSSHLLLELDELVDELLVLDEGEVLYQGAPAKLRGSAACVTLRVDEIETAVAALARHDIHARPHRGRLELPVETSHGLGELHELLRSEGITLREYATHSPTLEEALLARLRERRRGSAT